jgi:uncharacterized protein
MKDKLRNRREFLALTGGGTAALFGAQRLAAEPEAIEAKPRDGDLVLFNALRPQENASDVRKVKKVTVDNVECPSWPLQSLGAATVNGAPRASGKAVFETDDHAISGGVWKCSPGTFDLTLTWDEMALLLEGDLIIEESPEHKVHVRPGDFFFVPKGTKTRWTVVKPMKKVFFSRE